MPRRSAALVVLLTAIGVAVLPSLRLADIAGSPAPADLNPPTVGSCVDLEPERVVIVDCTSIHYGEVVLEWPSGPADLPAVIPPADCVDMVQPLPVDDAGEQLTGDLFYRTGWVLVPAEGVAVVARGPANQVGTAFDWSVCLITAGAPYAGQITGANRIDRVPDAFRSCEGSNGPLSCARPHLSERLAIKWAVLSDADTGGTDTGRAQQVRETQAASCNALAAGVTDDPDPTHDGRLTVEVVVDATRTYQQQDRPAEALFAFDAGCVIASAVPLTGSLVGYGSGSLPYG